MEKTITNEFLVIMNKLRKLTNKHHHKDMMVHQGEFMMLGAIHGCMEEKSEDHMKEPGVKVSELSALIHSTKPATSKMLNTLQEKGYIERISDNRDRRVVYIRLSATGETIIKEALHRMHNFADRTIQRMGEEDAKDLIRILNKFYEAVYEEIKEKSGNAESPDKNDKREVKSERS